MDLTRGDGQEFDLEGVAAATRYCLPPVSKTAYIKTFPRQGDVEGTKQGVWCQRPISKIETFSLLPDLFRWLDRCEILGIPYGLSCSDKGLVVCSRPAAAQVSVVWFFLGGPAGRPRENGLGIWVPQVD